MLEEELQRGAGNREGEDVEGDETETDASTSAKPKPADDLGWA